MADCHESKSAKKNKKRAQKRLEARLEKIKQDGVVEKLLEQDPITALKMKLQEAKDRKDHKLAAEIRHQLWIEQDKAAGYSVVQVEGQCEQPIKLSEEEKKQDSNKNTPTEVTSSLDPLEKRLRNLKKKLQQIKNLKAKKEQGEALEETQIKKIALEDEITAEINEIQVSLSGVKL